MLILTYMLFLRAIFEKRFFIFLLKLESLIILMFIIGFHFFLGANALICVLIIAVLEGCAGLICLVNKIRRLGRDMVSII